MKDTPDISGITVDGIQITEDECRLVAMYFNRLQIGGLETSAEKIRWARKELAYPFGLRPK